MQIKHQFEQTNSARHRMGAEVTTRPTPPK
jgi:hypothetical protein